MKKSILIILTLVAVIGLMFAFTGCDLVADVESLIDQSKCEHNFGTDDALPHERVEATCTSKGWVTEKCSLCGKLQTTDIPMTEHKAEYVETVFPTCTEEGLTNYSVCKDCGHEISHPSKIAPLGHTPEVVPGTKATCLTPGVTDGSKCSVCAEIIVAQKVIPAYGHKVISVPKKDATCTEPGYTAGQKCQYCNEIYVGLEVIPALGHSFDENMVCEECDLEFSFESIASSSPNTEKPLVGETLSQGLYSYSGLSMGTSTPSAILTFSEAKYLNGNTFSSNQEGFDEPLAVMFAGANLYLVSGDEILTFLDFGGQQLPPGFVAHSFINSSDEEGYKDATDGVEHYVHDASTLYLLFTNDTISLTFCADESGKLFTESTTLTFNLSDLVFAEVNSFNKVIM